MSTLQKIDDPKFLMQWKGNLFLPPPCNCSSRPLNKPPTNDQQEQIFCTSVASKNVFDYNSTKDFLDSATFTNLSNYVDDQSSSRLQIAWVLAL